MNGTLKTWMTPFLGYSWALILSLGITFCNQGAFTNPQSKLFFSLQLWFKTFNVQHIVIRFANFLVLKLYPCSMFHTILILHLNYFQDLNSCFVIWLFDPFGSTNFESSFNSYCFVNFNSLQLLVCFWL
jgi:hypothetical protein